MRSRNGALEATLRSRWATLRLEWEPLPSRGERLPPGIGASAPDGNLRRREGRAGHADGNRCPLDGGPSPSRSGWLPCGRGPSPSGSGPSDLDGGHAHPGLRRARADACVSPRNRSVARQGFRATRGSGSSKELEPRRASADPGPSRLLRAVARTVRASRKFFRRVARNVREPSGRFWGGV